MFLYLQFIVIGKITIKNNFIIPNYSWLYISMWNKDINEFIKKLTNYAPGGSSGKSNNYFENQKYPYKVV